MASKGGAPVEEVKYENTVIFVDLLEKQEAESKLASQEGCCMFVYLSC